MNQISSEHLLSQIRTLGRDLQIAQTPVAKPESGVGDLFKNTLNAVNEAQKTSGELKIGFENGTGSASLAEVQIAAAKADLSFRAVTEVRNKLVAAYQDIMNMPV
jgi:flagellar hook-basal body complex protein FliE